jgi:WD40 repeat protein
MIVLKAHDGRVYDLRFSPDGRTLATAGGPPGVRVYDPAGGAERWVADPPATAAAAVRFTADGALLVALEEAVPVVRDAATGAVLRRLPGTAHLLDLAPGDRALLADVLTLVPVGPRWVDVRTGAELATWPPRNRDRVGTRAACSPDGRHVANLTTAGLALHDAVTGAVKAEAGVVSLSRTLAFAPDGRRLYHADGPHLIARYVGTLSEAARGKHGAKHPQDLAVTPDGRHVLTVSNDKTVVVWDAATCQPVRTYDWKIGKLHAVAVSPDGTLAAAGGDTGKIVVWDVDI